MPKTILITGLIVLGSLLGARANQNFTLHNETPWKMKYVYVSPHNSHNWGTPAPNPVAAEGDSYFSWPYDNDEGPYDLRIVFSNGRDVNWGWSDDNHPFDLSQINHIYITYDSGDHNFHASEE
jgi:hypothetical protein